MEKTWKNGEPSLDRPANQKCDEIKEVSKGPAQNLRYCSPHFPKLRAEFIIHNYKYRDRKMAELLDGDHY